MVKINAKGAYYGEQVDFTVSMDDHGNIQLDIRTGSEFRILDGLESMIEDPPPIGGTYYPQPGTMFAVLSILLSTFFDTAYGTEVTVDGDMEEMESIEGVVY